jgi:hypothetical protein
MISQPMFCFSPSRLVSGFVIKEYVAFVRKDGLIAHVSSTRYE